MIRSFADKETERIFHRERSRKLPGDIQQRAREKLMALDAATELRDLRNPPGNRLEALRGNRTGSVFHSHQPSVARMLPLAAWACL